MGLILLDQVLKTISRYNMLASSPMPAAGFARVAVAVSGGPDSVCLLHVLRELAPCLKIELSVIHFNHKLRGADSDEDERFVAQLARRMELPFSLGEAGDLSERGNLEQRARDARRAFFQALRREGKADLIALGHTLDDQGETVLFRLLRGAGTTGIAGILPVTNEGLIRPLLGTRRTDVQAYLRERGVEFRQDASNLDPRFSRNRIRSSLMPLLASEWNPRIEETLAKAADLAYEEERWWRAWVSRQAPKYLTPRAGGIEMDVRRAVRLPPAALRRLLRHAVASVKGGLRQIDFEHMEGVLELVNRRGGAGRIQLPGAEAIRSFDWVRIAPIGTLEPPESKRVMDGRSIEWGSGSDRVRLERTSKSPGTSCATLKAAEIPLNGLEMPLEVRAWRPGDRYRAVGQRREHTVQELFQRSRVPSWRRPFWPMVTAGSKILWAKQFGVAADLEGDARGGPILRISEIQTQAAEPFEGGISS